MVLTVQVLKEYGIFSRPNSTEIHDFIRPNSIEIHDFGRPRSTGTQYF